MRASSYPAVALGVAALLALAGGFTEREAS